MGSALAGGAALFIIFTILLPAIDTIETDLNAHADKVFHDVGLERVDHIVDQADQILDKLDIIYKQQEETHLILCDIHGEC